MTIFGNQSFDELVASINRTVEKVDETEVQTTEITDESQQRTEEYRVDTNVFEKDQPLGNSQLGLSSQVKDTQQGNSFFGTASQQEVKQVENTPTPQTSNPFFGATSTTNTSTSATQSTSTTQSTNPFFGTASSSTTSSADTSSQEEPKNTATVWNPGGTTTPTSKSPKPSVAKQTTNVSKTDATATDQLNSITADPTGLDAKTIDAIAEAVVNKLQERLSK